MIKPQQKAYTAINFLLLQKNSVMLCF